VNVLDVEGKEVPFGSLFSISGKPKVTILVFLRHFL